MSPQQTKSPMELMRQCWAAQIGRGEKPQRAFALVALTAGEHPVGHVLKWGLLRKYVEQQHEQRGDAEKWEIREFEPS